VKEKKKIDWKPRKISTGPRVALFTNGAPIDTRTSSIMAPVSLPHLTGAYGNSRTALSINFSIRFRPSFYSLSLFRVYIRRSFMSVRIAEREKCEGFLLKNPRRSTYMIFLRSPSNLSMRDIDM